jgi:cell wall-associated NlpC family hydrolase
MSTREEVVREARGWIGTRYRHQGHAKGLGCDCGGLVYGVGLELGLLPSVDQLPARFKGYPKLPSDMAAACADLLVPIQINSMRHGDVVLMKFNEQPQHVAILGDYVHGGLSLIHAYAPVRKVVESRMDESFRSLVLAAFSYPGVQR